MGHYAPMRAIARDLVMRGFEVTVLTGPLYRESAEEVGASFVPLQGYYKDFTDPEYQKDWFARRPPPGPEQLAYDLTENFMKAMPEQYACVQNALRILREKDPTRLIVVVNEVMAVKEKGSQTGA